ncbi:hypothetical protein ACO1O0_004350 [Amphichorda felina]
MYLRGVHAENCLPILRRIVRENPLGLFTTAISSPSFPFLQASHIPFVLDIEDESSETELGKLRGHIARPNPQSKAIIEEVSDKQTKVLEHEVLVMFTPSAHHYVTPKFYKETKPATGKVVPTWNYTAVQVYGRATVFVDPQSEETSAFLDSQTRALTENSETGIMGYDGKGGNPAPWDVSDAPERYRELLKKNIIGVEITIDRMEGKFKMSQEMSDGDVDGVIDGFRNLDTETGREMADTVEQRRELKKAKQ